MNYRVLTAALFAAMGVIGSQSALAAGDSGGTITFDGEVTDSTCLINPSTGGSSFNVNMGTVNSSTLNAAGKTFGGYAVDFELKDCPAAVTKAWPWFLATNLIDTTAKPGTGMLKIRQNAGDAKNVLIQLLNSAENNLTEIDLGGTDWLAQRTVPIVIDPVTHMGKGRYVARYYATAQAVAGLVHGTLEYGMHYE